MARTKTDRDGETPERKAAYQPRSEDVVNWLRTAIEEGRLQPGERIGQESIAAELGVSRIPVREALRRLELEGLVVNPPHRSARVAPLDFVECEEIYKMRERLEPLALAESIAHASDEQIEDAAALATSLEAMRGDPTDWLMADRQLHLACYAGVQTPRLLELIVGFWSTTQQYRRVLLSTFAERDFEVQHMEHELMIDALAARNTRAGEDLVRAHIERSRLRLTRNLDLFSS